MDEVIKKKKDLELVNNLFELWNMLRKIPFLLWPFESGKRKGKKQQNIKYLKNERSFFEEIKTIFHNFWNAFFW